MIRRLIKKSIQLTPSHLSDDVSYSWFHNCFDLPHIYVHFMTLAALFPAPLVQFYVNAAEKDSKTNHKNRSLWNDKTATHPPLCAWICFILPDALQSSIGGTMSCVNQIEPDNCLIHLEPMFVPESWKQQPLAFLHRRLKNCKCLQKKWSGASPWGSSCSLSFWCTPQTTPYIKNPSYLIWAVALGISANSKGAEL